MKRIRPAPGRKAQHLSLDDLKNTRGGGLAEWLGLGDVSIVPGTNVDRHAAGGREAERDAAESRH